MDLISELTNKKNPDAANVNRITEFLDQANEDIRAINKLINKYNLERDHNKKVSLLQDIEEERKVITLRYPPSYLAWSADFSEQIQKNLFNAIKQERANLVLQSRHPKNSLADIIENMSAEKITRLMEILIHGSLFNRDALSNLYTQADPEYSDFQEFLNSITTIEFLDGNNSRNFKISYPNGDALVLKLENRLDQPALIEDWLQSDVLKDVLTPNHVRRQGTFTYYGEDGNNHTVNRALIVTDFCQGGDLLVYGKQHTDDNAKIHSALDIYIKMGNILMSLTQAKYAFPDMKNTNWLMDSNGSLKIADTKSFINIDEKGLLDQSLSVNTWSPVLLRTNLVSPSEFNTDYESLHCSADKMHVYILGKNLYQYLTNCEMVDMDKKFNYEKDLFKTPEGRQLKVLIQSMVNPRAHERIPTQDALQRLNSVKNLMASMKKTAELKAVEQTAETERPAMNKTITNCETLLNEMESLRIGKHDEQMNAFKRKELKNLLAIKTLSAAKENYERLKNILAMNEQTIPKLNQYLSSIRHSVSYYRDNKPYREIKDACLSVPVEERVHINRKDNTRSAAVENLQRALDKHCPQTWLGNWYIAVAPTHSKPVSKQFKQKLSETSHNDEALNPMLQSSKNPR
jgi:hypothetical protein